jgi:hypothetical protein
MQGRQRQLPALLVFDRPPPPRFVLYITPCNQNNEPVV